MAFSESLAVNGSLAVNEPVAVSKPSALMAIRRRQFDELSINGDSRGVDSLIVNRAAGQVPVVVFRRRQPAVSLRGNRRFIHDSGCSGHGGCRSRG